MFRRFTVWTFALLLGIAVAAPSLLAQGPDTKASKDDWEEINFEFNSSVLVDGFPSMLRLADLLKANPPFRVHVEGNTDHIGSKRYNERLGMARANAVRDFLIKYGAAPNQITADSVADNKPRARATKPGYSPTDEGRYMNRRVVLTVMNAQGQPVGDGSAGDAIRTLASEAGVPGNCCNDLQHKIDALSEKLDKLGQLDNIEKLLAGLADENKRLKDQMDALKKAQDALQTKADQTQQAVAAIPPAPSADAVAKASADEHERRNPKFEMLGMNVGPTSSGDATFTGKGRYFSPIGTHFALQGEAEYFYSKGQREGQFDFGGVERINRFQAGLFASFKHVNLTGDQTGGTLGQAALTADYIFKWGKVGAYGTKAFLDDALVNSVAAVGANGAILNDIFTQRYLRVVDSAGVAGTGPLFHNAYFEGNMGYLKSTTSGDRFGGTLRLIFPLEKLPIAFTVEGGVNETLLGTGNTGRAVVGLQFGNMMRPKELLAANHAVPAQIPRLRYEVLTRNVRIGNDPPVANAGPNQSFTGAATVTLDGSKSYDPNGDPLTYLWQQDGGAPATLANPNAAITTFAAAAGQDYTFRLTVTDPSGASSVARVAITTGGPVIVFFTATPATAGQPAMLNWSVMNADTVTITGLGNVALQGSAPVTPLSTTVYQLTATRGTKVATASVSVAPAAPIISTFTTSPSTISAGQTSTLSWTVAGADTVSITTLGNVNTSGSTTVSPTATTTYVLTATKGGLSSTASATVTVNGTAIPIIQSFTATPNSISPGQSTTLSWQVTGADTVSISGLGNVTPNGSVTVTPATTTTYVMTASRNGVTTSASVTVSVVGGAKPMITSFTVSQQFALAGTPLQLSCSASNATSISITGAGLSGATINAPSATVTIMPFVNTTYICVATGSSGLTDQQQLNVNVIPVGFGGN